MKKIAYILFAASAIAAAVSCNKEVDQVTPEKNGKVTVLTAHADNGIVSKTTLDGVNVVWGTSDVITAFDEAGNCYNSTETQILENGSIAKFTVPTDNPVFAVYPAYEEGEEVEMANGKITATIPTRQNAINNTFDNGANVEVAKITDKDNIKFKNVGGLLAVKVKGTTHNIASIKIADAGGVYKMTGTVTAGFDADGNVMVDDIAEGEGYVDLTGDITANETYYAVVAPGIYEGVTITFTDEDGNTATYTKKTPLEVERNSNQLIGGFDIPESKWQTAEKYYVKVMSDEDIVAGDYLIVYETLNNDLEDEAEILSGVENKIGTVVSSAIIVDGDVKKIAWAENSTNNVVVEEGSNGYTMKLGDAYLAYNLPSGTTKNNNLFLVETAAENGAEWNLSVDGITNVYNSDRYLQYNATNPRFACYLTSSNMQNVSLYLLEGSGHSSGKVPAGLAYEITEFEITLGEAFSAPNLTNPHSLTVSYDSNNTDVATVDASTGAVTIVAVGTAKITATFAGNEEYKEGSAFYTITVNPVKDFIFYESFDKCVDQGGNDGSWSGSGVADGALNADNDGWAFEKGSGADKCAKFGTTSVRGSATTPALGITNETTATLTFKAGAWDGGSEKTTLNVSVEGNGQASVKSVTMAKGEFTEFTVILGNGIDETTKVKFSAADASNSRFFLDEVKVVAGGEMPVVKEDPTMTFSPSEVEVTLGETFTRPTLTTDPAGLAVTYSSSKPEVATVDANSGAITLVAAGTTVITATFAGNENYYEASASYTLKVNSAEDNGDGSLDNPFNIAGVYEYINNSGTESVYVQGIISSIADGGEYGVQYGNASFFISDDGTTESNQFEAYRVLFLGNKKWQEENTQIQVGDAVILYGKVTKFGDTYETSQNNAYLYSLNGVSTVLDAPSITATTSDSEKTITVTWGAVSGATSYVVYCDDQTYTAGQNETSHTFTMADFGTYSYKVVAKGSNIEVGISETKEVTLNDPSVSFINVPSQSFTFSSLGYTNQAEVSTIAGTNNCSIVFNKGTNSNAPKYYTSGTAVRAYGGNTITITPAEGYKVCKIVITFGTSDGNNAITANMGTYNNGTWTGEAKGTPVVFTIGGTTGNRRIVSIAINPAE